MSGVALFTRLRVCVNGWLGVCVCVCVLVKRNDWERHRERISAYGRTLLWRNMRGDEKGGFRIMTLWIVTERAACAQLCVCVCVCFIIKSQVGTKQIRGAKTAHGGISSLQATHTHTPYYDTSVPVSVYLCSLPFILSDTNFGAAYPLIPSHPCDFAQQDHHLRIKRRPRNAACAVFEGRVHVV